MNKHQLKDSIAYLDRILGGEKPERTHLDLCGNLNNFVYCFADDYIKSIAPDWKKFTGSSSYPVPHPTMHPAIAYYAISNLWDRRTQYGKNRYEFCEFVRERMIKDLEKNDE